MRSTSVVITGSLSYDFIMDFSGRFADRIMPDKIHKISLSFLVDTLNKQFGGTAANQAYTLKLLGIEPTIVTAAGNDWKEYFTFLKKHKIPIGGITVFPDEPCRSYHVVTDKDDNQIGAFYIGASRYNHTLTIPKNAEFIIIGPTDPKAMVRYVGQCRGKKYLYDPAFQIGNFTAEELRKGISGAEILIGNDYEIALIEQKLEVTHKELITMVPILVTTLGSKGSIIEKRKESIHCKPAKPVAVSDPTGAGDTFCGAFLTGLCEGKSLTECAKYANAAGAMSVRIQGPMEGAPSRKELEVFIKNH